jgi:hypothetical protein
VPQSPEVYRAASLLAHGRVPFWLYAGPAFLVASILLFADNPWASAAALAGFLVTFALLAKSSRFEVGLDGVSLEWLGWRRFFPRDEIADVSFFKRGLRSSRQRGVALRLRNGTSVKVPMSEHDTVGAWRAIRALGIEESPETRA